MGGDLGGHGANLGDRGVQGGTQQRGVVAVGAGGDQPKGDARCVGRHRVFAALFAAVDRGAAGDLAAAGRLGDTAVGGYVGEVQADDLVVGLQRLGVELLGETSGGPLLEES